MEMNLQCSSMACLVQRHMGIWGLSVKYAQCFGVHLAQYCRAENRWGGVWLLQSQILRLSPSQSKPAHYHFLPLILYKLLQHIQQSHDKALSSLLAEIKSIVQQISYWVNNVNGFLTILNTWLLTVPYFILFQSFSGNEVPTCLAAWFP